MTIEERIKYEKFGTALITVGIMFYLAIFACVTTSVIVSSKVSANQEVKAVEQTIEFCETVINEDHAGVYDYVDKELNRLLREGRITPKQAHKIGLLQSSYKTYQSVDIAINEESKEGQTNE